MRGFGAIGVVIAMALVAFLVLVYLRSAVPTGEEMEGHRTAIGGAKQRAADVEAQQRQRFEEMQRSLDE